MDSDRGLEVIHVISELSVFIPFATVKFVKYETRVPGQ